jgi:hypothetical protein
LLGLCTHVVAPAERCLNRRRIPAVHPGADVHSISVVDEPHFHPLCRWSAFNRFFLREVVDDRRLFPGCIIEAAIQANGPFGHADDGGPLRKSVAVTRLCA